MRKVQIIQFFINQLGKICYYWVTKLVSAESMSYAVMPKFFKMLGFAAVHDAEPNAARLTRILKGSNHEESRSLLVAHFWREFNESNGINEPEGNC